MKTCVIAGLVVFGVLVAHESPAASGPEDAIKQVFAQVDQCVANNDAKCIGELMLDDSTFSTPMNDAKILKGKAQIVKTVQGLMGDTPNTKGGKQTHVVENVRMIGTDHALVDTILQVAGMKASENDAASGPHQAFHGFAVMTLKGDKWFIQDLRTYTVGPAWAMSKPESAAGEKKSPAQPDKAAQPEKKDAAPAANGAAKEPAPAPAH